VLRIYCRLAIRAAEFWQEADNAWYPVTSEIRPIAGLKKADNWGTNKFLALSFPLLGLLTISSNSLKLWI
jgi:hypothetical protein